jgi:trk system potassium uptake protein TrkA
MEEGKGAETMHVIVIGCGRVGSGLARRLGGQGHEVVVVDTDPGSLERLGAGFRGRYIRGVGFDADVLAGAGIGRADALAAVTGSDEVNGVVARVATQRFHVPRVVCRLYDPRQSELYRRLGILTISPVEWGIERLSELLLLKDVGGLRALGGGQVHLVEGMAGSGLAGRPVAELELPGEIRVVTVTRGSRSFVPDAGTMLSHGDLVTAVVAAAAAPRFEQLLGGT